MASNIVEYILNLKTNKASAKLGNIATRSKEVSSGLKTMAGAVVGVGLAFAAAGAALLKFAQSQADVINDLNDLSVRSGVSAKSINALKLAFVASGQEASTVKGLLDKMPMILSSIDKGAGNASKRFEDFNLKLRDSEGEMRSADDVMNDMIIAVQGVENPTERAAAAVDLFGRQSANLMQALGNQSSLKAFSDITERYGVDVGPEASKQAAQFQQSIGVLSVIVERFGQVFAKIFGLKGFVAPLSFAMEMIVELTNVISNSTTFIKALIPRMHKEFDLAVLEIKKMVLDLKDEILGFVSFIVPIDVTQLQEDRKKTFKEIRGIKSEIADLPDITELFVNINAKSRKDTVAFMHDFNQFLDNLEGSGDGVKPPPPPIVPEIEDPEKSIKNVLKMADIPMGIKVESVDISEAVKGISDSLADALDFNIVLQKITTKMMGFAQLLTSGPQKITEAILNSFGPIGGIISEAIGAIASLGQPVIEALNAGIDRSIELSTSSMQDIISAQKDAAKTLDALKRPDSKEAQAASRVAKTEQKIQAETLKNELAALRGAPGEDMAMAREIAMLQAEIQAVTFANALGQAIQMLPGILFRVLPSMLVDLSISIVEAIFSLPMRIWEALKEGFRSVVEALTLGLGDKFEAAGNWFKESGQSIKEFILSIGKGQGGLRFTGQESGLAILHRNETVVPESGRRSQQTSRSMAEHAGGGGVNISINSLVTERSAIDELVRQIERRFSSYGNSRSILFN